MKVCIEELSEHIIRTERGELPDSEGMNWMTILQTLCSVYRKCYLQAVKEQYRLLQIGFTIVWMEKSMIAKDFTLDKHVDMDTIISLMLDYFKKYVANFGAARYVKYYVVSEQFKVLQ